MSDLDTADNFDKKIKKIRRLNLIDYTKRKDEALRDQKIKSLIDFDEEYCCSIRSLATKKVLNEYKSKIFERKDVDVQ